MVSLEEAHKDGLVVGLKDVNGVKERLDIDILLLKHPDTFNLLVMALKEIKGEEVPWKIDPDFMVRKEDKMSYYQMAGKSEASRARSMLRNRYSRTPLSALGWRTRT